MGLKIELESAGSKTLWFSSKKHSAPVTEGALVQKKLWNVSIIIFYSDYNDILACACAEDLIDLYIDICPGRYYHSLFYYRSCCEWGTI